MSDVYKRQRKGHPERAKAIAEWEVESKLLKEARVKAGVPEFISHEDQDEYTQVIAEQIAATKLPDAPAMPVVAKGNASIATSLVTNYVSAPRKGKGSSESPNRPHQSRIAGAGSVSEEYFAMVHKPIPINKALQIPEAKAALDKEWNKLKDKKAWLVETVSEKRDIQEKAKREGKKVHFGALMDLCHLKHAELAAEFQKYKGRVVFRGDAVKAVSYTHLTLPTILLV